MNKRNEGSVRELLKQHGAPSLTLDEEHEARKRRNLKKYGVESTSCVPEIKNKIKQSKQQIKKQLIEGDSQFQAITAKHFVYIFRRPDPSEDVYLQPFYVGKGKDQRPQRHIIAARRGWKDGNDHKINTIRKYLNMGLLPVIEVIECSSEQEAFDLEISLISKWGRRGIDKGGILTNINPGGEGNTGGHKPVKQYNLFGEYIQTFGSCLEAARSFGKENSSSIVECCKKKSKSAHGYFWSYAEQELDLDWCIGGKKKPVYQWDLQGNFVARYVNSYQAAMELQKPDWYSGEISRCAKNSNRTCENFRWTYENISPGPYTRARKSTCTKVLQYTIDGELLAEFDSFYDANLTIGKKGNDNQISKSIKNSSKICYGYVWKLG